MIVSFVGCPSSGKTTLAAMLFAEAKRRGACSVDLLTEQARLYIASKRRDCSERRTKFALTPDDQVNMMAEQVILEEDMAHSLGEDGLLITDTCPLNALLYMPQEVSTSPEVTELVLRTLQLPKRSIFYCAPVPMEGVDPNRVHTAAEAQAIDKKIREIMDLHCPYTWDTVTHLTHADLDARYIVLAREIAFESRQK